MASTSAACDTSALTKRASPPACLIRSTVSSPPSTTTSATTTLAPSRAKARAEARPMPELPPVTSATFPLSMSVIVDPPLFVFTVPVHHSTEPRCLHRLPDTWYTVLLLRGKKKRWWYQKRGGTSRASGNSAGHRQESVGLGLTGS